MRNVSEDQQLLFFIMLNKTKPKLKVAGGKLSEFNCFYLDATILRPNKSNSKGFWVGGGHQNEAAV